MKYVLDTNMVRAVMGSTPQLVQRLSELRVLDVGLPQPVVAEIAVGVALLPRSRKKKLLRAAFDDVLRTFPRSAWTDEVSEAFGELKAFAYSQGRPIEDFDIAIAAHAVVEGAVLVTANVRHFARFPDLAIENWLEPH
jgi:tRNA(fMet)-specific endonuclease VapC